MVVDARNNVPHYLRESASQTAGPYVHIGLAPGAAGSCSPGSDAAGSTATVSKAPSGLAISELNVIGHEVN